MAARRLGRAATTVLMVAAIAAAMATVAARFAGVRPLVEQSSSMAPAIAPGDLVLSRSVAAESLRVGEIVTFHDAARHGLLVTHRVQAVHEANGTLQVTTRGDANPTGEQWTTAPDDQLGRTIAVLPYVGTAFAAVSDPLVAGCLVAIVVTVLVLAIARRRPATR